MEKSQVNLQNNVHLHDIVEEIKELANPFMDQFCITATGAQSKLQNESYDIYEYYYF
ncbi:hypothetical protein SAMN04487919_120114 [Bacillus sp. ok061]|nr:hypothetical protein SAMN04487919_120114 [Bacillus sp. ok061]